ncbi:hypothetical protein [Nonomuraea sp. SBT364]|uniref:hypothetical protein n=1 Tax=Nonomuraea sp. SBT364 TaxID=1580530 RepID=UPI00066BE936|nr:hypothetical protein [Nonomuraea sp. SBT364]
MRRWIVVAAAALFALAPNAAAAAQSAAPDPVQAMKRQFRAERGVDFTEVARLLGAETRSRRQGGIAFGPGGPVATYLSVRDVGVSAPEDETRAVAGGDALYTTTDVALPKDKNWVVYRYPEGQVRPEFWTTQQTIDVFDPASLKVTLKGAKGKAVSGGYYFRGDVTYAELSKAAGGTYAIDVNGVNSKAKAKAKVAWKLWTDSSGRIQRFMTTDISAKGAWLKSVDTRFSEWGRLQTIPLPSAEEVIDHDEVGKVPSFPKGLSLRGKGRH